MLQQASEGLPGGEIMAELLKFVTKFARAMKVAVKSPRDFLIYTFFLDF